MGGSNGGGGGFGPFVPRHNDEDKVDACLNLSFTTDLASVDPSVLASVREGDVYEVKAETEKGPVGVFVEGKRLGTILHMKDVQLLTCIYEGTDYQAKILSVDGGKCQVQISAKR